MKIDISGRTLRPKGLKPLLSIFLTAFLFSSNANAFTVEVRDQNENLLTNGFRWQLEEDRTHYADPGTLGTQTNKPLALTFFTSNHPSTTHGLVQNSGSTVITTNEYDTNKRYFLSILPVQGKQPTVTDAGFTLGGAVVAKNTTDTDTITVHVSALPIPTAQIAIYLFHDNHPTNGAPDLPLEIGIDGGVEGFEIILEDAGGGYGVTAGRLQNDAFGNPLGTKYNTDGSVLTLGDGTITTDANGRMLIKNLPPGKYGVQVIPPAGSDWIQTSTIEGTPVIDAWVKANEPSFFAEFGPPGPHVFVGMVHKKQDTVAGLPGVAVSGPITGRITNNHMARPPVFGANSGNAFPGCYVGINDAIIAGNLIKVVKCSPSDVDLAPTGNFPGAEDTDINGNGIFDAEGSFTLPSLPVGDYMLSIWDGPLRMVIATATLSVTGNSLCVNPKTPNAAATSCDLGELPVFSWFGRYDTVVFYDANENGVRDPGELPINDLAVTLRHRNGVVYQTSVTDFDGAFTFESVFPFFNWLVAEVDYGFPMKATGATFITDNGGGTVAPNPGDTFGLVSDGSITSETFTHEGDLVPQPQCLPNGFDIATGDCQLGMAIVTNPVTNDHFSRTETGPILTQGIQTFLGTTNYAEWGKAPYQPGENGGISGVTYYAVTRAEDDPKFAVLEPWEPGIPRVVVNLYADGDTAANPFTAIAGNGANGCPVGTYVANVAAGDIDWNNNGCLEHDDKIIEDVNHDGFLQFADVDNYPFDWAPQHQFEADGVTQRLVWTGNPGPEDLNHTNITDPNMGYTNGYDAGDAIQIVASDSWDDSLPTGCQGPAYTSITGTTTVQTDCFDGLRNFNQWRPGVFDGGYAFDSYYVNGFDAAVAGTNTDTVISGLPAGDYIVEGITPPGYELLKEEDKNVDFGESYSPFDASVAQLPAECVGESHVVSKYLSQQSDDSLAVPSVAGDLLPGIALADGVLSPPYANAADALVSRPNCDRKLVNLADGQNAATDFAYFTQVPKSAVVLGIILNDLANEFDPNKPTFGEKTAPAWVPVSFRDWTGREIVRVHSDEFGAYNALLPSTFSANIASASGYSPNMLTACMNDAGPIPDPSGLTNPDGSPKMIVDPQFNRQLSQFCYTFQYMPGGITYLDTPVVPVAAFARNGTFPVDCEFPSQTPGIYSVSNTNTVNGGPLAQPGNTLEILSAGLTTVANPLYAGITSVEPRQLSRDFGFGGNIGTVKLVKLTNPNKGDVITLSVDPVDGLGGSWSNSSITAVMDTVTSTGNAIQPGDYYLSLKNTSGISAETSVTVTVVNNVANPGFGVHLVQPSTVSSDQPIQTAIEAAADGDLILIQPGTYNEMVLMHKPVKLQGFGPLGVIINARKSPADKLARWRAQMKDQLKPTNELVGINGNGQFCVLPSQVFGANLQTGEPELFGFNEGAGITVLGDCGQTGNLGQVQPVWTINQARIDGLSITGSDSGGAIFVTQWAKGMVISNNRLVGNVGADGGGIHIGNNNLISPNGNVVRSENQDITINHNQIIENGGITGAGGGISLYSGADNYNITNNWICGNFTTSNGGGIGHLGVNDNGFIQNNKILFNQSFKQASRVDGGGIFISGVQSAANLSEGSGSVVIRENLIQGNNSGAGSGSGIRLQFVNGTDIVANPGLPGSWFTIDLFNNMIVDNVAGLSGAVSIQDALRVRIFNDTIANNDSTATTSLAFVGSGVTNLTLPKPAGVVVETHSNALALIVPGTEKPYSNPEIENSIIWQNRSFCWGATQFDQIGNPTAFGLHLSTDPICGGTLSEYDDLAVLPRGIGGKANPANKLSAASSYVTDLAQLDAASATTSFDVTSPGMPGPDFISAFPVSDVGQTINQPEATVPATAAAFDEGGNFIDVRYGPLVLTGNYHLNGTSPMLDAGSFNTLQALAFDNGAGGVASPVDFDFHFRPNGPAVDIGADEGQAGGLGGGGPVAVIDSDNDGVEDALDNCTLIANPGQENYDNDNYGDVCDGDFDNNGIININDLARFFGLMGSSGTQGDFDSNGSVNFDDLNLLIGMLGNQPGPSGL